MEGNSVQVVERTSGSRSRMTEKKEYCRICLIKFERRFMIPIFTLETKRLEHQIRSVVSHIEMSPSDEFSKCICIECALKVSTSFNFMEFCQENQKLLRSPLFSENLLVEATDNPQEVPLSLPHLSPPPPRPPPLARRQSASSNSATANSPNSSPSQQNLPPPPPLTSRRPTVSQLSPPTTTTTTSSSIPVADDSPTAEEEDEEPPEMTISSMLECQLNEGDAEDEEQAPRTTVDLPMLPIQLEGGIPPNNPYKCTVCFREFGKKANVLSHFQTQHTSLEVPSAWKYEIEPAKCPLCGVLVECLFAHLEHHAGRRTFKCESCEWAFYSKNYLSIHTQKLHKADAAIDARPDRFTCKQCPPGTQVCRDYDDLVAHYRQWHLNEMKNKLETCPLCNRETRYLKVHMEKMHNANGGQFQCNLCDKSYAKARYLQSHFTAAHKDHVQRTPPPLDYSMAANGGGQQPLVAAAPPPQQPPKQQKANNQPAAKRPRVHPGGPVHCVKCQMEFPNNRMLNMHIQRYHNANIHHPVTTTTAEVSVTAIPAAGPQNGGGGGVGAGGGKPPKKRRRDSVPVMGDFWAQPEIHGMLVNMFNGKGHYED